MKASEIKEEIYNKLVRLDYSRKENDLANANSINWFDLEDKLRDIIISFPARIVKFDEDLMGIEDLSGDQQFYLFHSDGNSYLVDTQGYTYPRYIVELEGYDDVIDDKFELMDGSARIADVIILEAVVKSLALEFKKEGFDKVDIINFIDAKIYGALLEK